MGLEFNIMDLISKYMTQYQEWVRKNPQQATSVENFVKFSSYFLGGKSSSPTAFLPELIYCASNLLSFYHDELIRKTKSTNQSSSDSFSNRIRIILTAVDHCESFLEAFSTGQGEVPKWMMVTILQVVKTIGNLLLLKNNKTSLLLHPPIPAMNNKQRQNATCVLEINDEDDETSASRMVFTLKRSGRIVRKIECAPVLSQRSWQLPKALVSSKRKPRVNMQQLVAEILFTVRPLVHLSFMFLMLLKKKKSSWQPWLIALALDITSLYLHRKLRTSRTPSEDHELRNRTLQLLFYLLRSPFYERFTDKRLSNTLNVLSNNVPLVGVVLQPLAQCIPQWQKMYSYMWSN